jgi:hypothetical protein
MICLPASRFHMPVGRVPWSVGMFSRRRRRHPPWSTQTTVRSSRPRRSGNPARPQLMVRFEQPHLITRLCTGTPPLEEHAEVNRLEHHNMTPIANRKHKRVVGHTVLLLWMGGFWLTVARIGGKAVSRQIRSSPSSVQHAHCSSGMTNA